MRRLLADDWVRCGARAFVSRARVGLDTATSSVQTPGSAWSEHPSPQGTKPVSRWDSCVNAIDGFRGPRSTWALRQRVRGRWPPPSGPLGAGHPEARIKQALTTSVGSRRVAIGTVAQAWRAGTREAPLPSPGHGHWAHVSRDSRTVDQPSEPRATAPGVVLASTRCP
jgi:hypothetical protein